MIKTSPPSINHSTREIYLLIVNIINAYFFEINIKIPSGFFRLRKRENLNQVLCLLASTKENNLSFGIDDIMN